MADQEYTNVFVDVHNKIKLFKDRLRAANEGDAEDRKNRLTQEAAEILDKDVRPSN